MTLTIRLNREKFDFFGKVELLVQLDYSSAGKKFDFAEKVGLRMRLDPEKFDFAEKVELLVQLYPRALVA